MAFRFGNASSDRVTLADHANLTFPDQDWAISILGKFTTRVGTSERNVVDFGGGSTPFFFARIGDASHASRANDMMTAFQDDDGTNVTHTSTSDPWLNNTSWWNVIIERSGNTITTYFNNGSISSGTNASLDALNASTVWKFGNNVYDSVVFQGDLAEFGKWDRALTSAEKAALSGALGPYHAPSFFRNSLKVYVPMIRDYNELVVGIAVTNNGTSVVEHPRVIYPD